MLRIRYSVLTFRREISLKVLLYVTNEWFVFFRVTRRFFKDEKNQLMKMWLRISLKVLLYVTAGWFVFFRVTRRFFKDEKNQLMKMWSRLPLLFRIEFQVLKKVHFEPNSIAVSMSLLIREARLHLKYENSFILSYSSL